ncbi:hypothetical protein ACN28S_51215 [Cystobacter fuscus]
MSQSSRPKSRAHPASTASASPAWRHSRRATSTASRPAQKMPVCSRNNTASPSSEAPTGRWRREASGVSANASPSTTGSAEAFSLRARGRSRGARR